MLKLGILAPHSNLIRSMARDYRTALELGLAHHALQYEIVIESAGYNAGANAIRGPLNKLILQYQVDTIIAPLNPMVVSEIYPILDENETPLLITTMGENLMPNDVQSPYIMMNSFHLWQCAWLSGYEFVKRYGNKVTVATGFHDGGYAVISGLKLGIEAASGELKQTLVSPKNADSDSFTQLLERMMELNTDLLIGHFSGAEARAFVTAYQNMCYENRPHLAVLPQTLSALNLETTKETMRLSSLSSWDPSTPESSEFRTAFNEKTGREPCVYSMLAYEAGALLTLAHSHNPATTDQGVFAETLVKTRIDGPRGETALEPSTRHSGNHNPFYLQEYGVSGAGVNNQVVKSIDTPEICFEDLRQSRKKGFDSGWLNPYLII